MGPEMNSRLENALPCPFCDSEWIVKEERYFAMYVDCGATGPERNGDATVRKFTGDWNSRTQRYMDATPELSTPEIGDDLNK